MKRKIIAKKSWQKNQGKGSYWWDCVSEKGKERLTWLDCFSWRWYNKIQKANPFQKRKTEKEESVAALDVALGKLGNDLKALG